MSDIPTLLEGVCPDCGEPAELIYLGGTEWFFDQYGQIEISADTVTVRWEETRDSYKINFSETKSEGEIEFLCSNGHKNTASVNSNGDWNE